MVNRLPWLTNGFDPANGSNESVVRGPQSGVERVAARTRALRTRHCDGTRPIAVIAPRGLLQLGAGYVATEWIADAQNLHLYLWRLARLPAVERLRQTRRTAVALGQLIGRMHAWRVAHRDLKRVQSAAERAGRDG